LHRASCLHLLIAAIAAWTTPYLAEPSARFALRVNTYRRSSSLSGGSPSKTSAPQSHEAQSQHCCHEL
jgi:hypothetical protein